MLNNKGMTLIETLMAFSIFVTVIVLILTLYSSAIDHHYKVNQNYQEYVSKQQIKEISLWQSTDLSNSIKEVLH